MEEAINDIVTELESHHNEPNSQTPISESTLSALQTLLDYTINKDDRIEIENLSDELSAKNLSLSSALFPPLTATMDSGEPHLRLIASRVYLSLLLTPNSPVLTLFTPITFLSLLRTIRRFFKNTQLGPPSGNPVRKKRGGGGKSKNKCKSIESGDVERETSREFDVRVLFPLLERLHLVLGLIHLGRFPDCLKDLVQTVAEIPVSAIESCGNSSNYNKLCTFCSDILSELLKSEHGDIGITASETFRKFHDDKVTKEWLHSVPRLITDNETSIQEECENLFLELVLDRISRAGSTDPRAHDPDGVMGLLKEICNGEVAPWVKKISTNLGKKKKLKPKIAISLQNIIKKSESMWLEDLKPVEKWTAPAGAWFLLSEVSVFLLKAVDWEFLYHHWQLLDKQETSNGLLGEQENKYEEDLESNSVDWAGDRVALLQTISNVSVELPAEPAADLAHNLLKRIEDFNMHSMEVSAHVKALITLCKRKAKNTKEANALVNKWVDQLLSKALETCITKNSEMNKNSSLITPTSGTQKGNRSSTIMSRLLTQAVTAVYTIGSLVIVCPSADLKTIVPILHNIITSGISDPKVKKLAGVQSSFKQTAPSLYIQAWLTMGKICLADDKLAKRYIPLFVQEMEKNDSAALRNNIVVMMADFCVRYTALVDCYISNITKCLCDPCELVRRQTFTLLSRLLQRDYVKWRGVLFLRFLLSLVDESEKIRQLADFLFGNILKVKAPLLAYNSFVEAIFVLNDCNAHTGQSNTGNSRKESSLFSIRGNDEKSRSQRMHIYVSLLKQMAPEHLLATFAKVCAEILASASDGMLKIDDVTSQSVLQDAFQILSCKEFRIPTNKTSLESSEIEEESAENTVKGRVITQAVKKGLIQNTIPIFVELKRLLESKNSPLSGSLMECLRILLKDYKNEIDEILVADKQLQKELIYDIQKYESLKVKSTAAEAVGNGVNVNINVSSVNTSSKVMSAVAGALAAATARSVLRDVNQGAGTPSLSAMNVPKLKSTTSGLTKQKGRSAAVLESLRRRQSFDLDDES